MKVRRIGVFSLAHVLGLISVLLGAIVSGLFALMLLVTGPRMPGGGMGMDWFGPPDGVFALFLVPLFYGGMAWIIGFVTALLYNLVAPWVGGLELEVE